MPSDPSDTKPRPGDEVFEAIGLRWGPDHLGRGLEAALALTQEKPKEFGQWAFSAFEAIRMIAESMPSLVPEEKHNQDFDIEPREPVNVPWWVIHTLAHGWITYLGSPRGERLGQAFDLEGTTAGARPRRDLFATLSRDLKLALEVLHRRERAIQEARKLSLAAAIGEVAEKFDLGNDVVRRAWRKHRSRVVAIYKNWGQNLED